MIAKTQIKFSLTLLILKILIILLRKSPQKNLYEKFA